MFTGTKQWMGTQVERFRAGDNDVSDKVYWMYEIRRAPRSSLCKRIGPMKEGRHFYDSYVEMADVKQRVATAGPFSKIMTCNPIYFDWAYYTNSVKWNIQFLRITFIRISYSNLFKFWQFTLSSTSIWCIKIF